MDLLAQERAIMRTVEDIVDFAWCVYVCVGSVSHLLCSADVSHETDKARNDRHMGVFLAWCTVQTISGL